MSGGEAPPNPFGPMMAAAVALHEVFRAYVSAGFSEPQAMQIIIAMLTTGLRNGTSGTAD